MKKWLWRKWHMLRHWRAFWPYTELAGRIYDRSVAFELWLMKHRWGRARRAWYWFHVHVLGLFPD